MLVTATSQGVLVAVSEPRQESIAIQILVTTCDRATKRGPGRRRLSARMFRAFPTITRPVAIAMLVCAVVGGCANDTSDVAGVPSGTPTVSAPALDAQGTAQARALAAYQGMWRAYAKAGATANADEPDLARYASGRALETLRDGLAQLKREGKTLQGAYGSTPQVAVSPVSGLSTITIEDCLDSSRFRTYRAGELADDPPGGHRAASAVVTRLDAGSTWKVTDFGVQAVKTC